VVEEAVRGVAVDVLLSYYSLLETWLTLLRFRGMGEEQAERWLRSIISEKLGEEFPRSRDPWICYRNRTTEAQERVQEDITAYLDRDIPPWGDRLTAATVRWLERQQRRRSRANRPGGEG
jgi:hypothetical protein